MILTYLRKFEPQELVHKGGNVYSTRTHDSLKISNGKWCWWSRNIGGKNALDYLTKVEGVPFLDAVQRILGAAPTPATPEQTAPVSKTEFALPPKHADNRRVFSYLHGRGIAPEIINHCIKTGQLYEDGQRHNCVFIGFEGALPRYATLRGTLSEKRFMGEVPGSDKRFSFAIPLKASSQTVCVFECAIDALSYALSGATFQNSILSMVAAVIGMIPEGLYLLASVALVVSVIRLASQKVLVHDMKCIEALARVDVLCVDKTGTITENEMRVCDVIPMEGFDPAQGVGLKAQISALIAAMPEGNMTMQALKHYFKTPSIKKAEAVFPFSSTYKYCAAVFQDDSYVLGAPEFVLRESYEHNRAIIDSYSSDGYRVLVFGKYCGVPDGMALTQPVIPIALVLLANPIRRDAPETFQYFAQQGVAIKVISGDNPLTVSRIAMEAGINGAEAYIDASTLDTEDALRDAAEQYTVFGRVSPEQKRQLIRVLQDAGHTVGMTGDGVNDVLALKDADCSVAMASGSDAAAQVSLLVLLESDFSAMPSVVAEGRRVVNNIERSASLFLVKNIFSFLMAVFSACFVLNYPLEPAQISLISVFTIGIPGFFLALQPNENAIQGRFLSNVLIKALPAGLTDFLVVGALVIFGRVFGVNESDISTACTMLLSIVGFMILYHISKPLNSLRWIIWTSCIAGLLICSIYLGDIFGITHMSMECIMLFVVFAIVTEPVLRYSTMVVERIGMMLKNRIHKKSSK